MKRYLFVAVVNQDSDRTTESYLSTSADISRVWQQVSTSTWLSLLLTLTFDLIMLGTVKLFGKAVSMYWTIFLIKNYRTNLLMDSNLQILSDHFERFSLVIFFNDKFPPLYNSSAYFLSQQKIETSISSCFSLFLLSSFQVQIWFLRCEIASVSRK